MRTRLASCSGKSSFTTWALAEQRAKVMRRRGERGLHVYRCEYCSACHVGGASIIVAPRANFTRRPIRYREQVQSDPD